MKIHGPHDSRPSQAHDQHAIFRHSVSCQPSIAFANAQTTGLYLANVDAGTMGIASGGQEVMTVGSGVVDIPTANLEVGRDMTVKSHTVGRVIKRCCRTQQGFEIARWV